MRNTMRGIGACLAACAIAAVPACSSSSGSDPSPSSSTSVAPAVPQITQAEQDTVAPNKKDADTLAKGGQPAKDAWYTGTLKAAKIALPDDSMIELRTTVCQMLKEGTTMDNLTDAMKAWPLDATQQGVVFSASMVSACPDTSVLVDKSAMPR